ncbi:hypothetical protein C8Q74DRAFT_1437248 [Fomes fomentarius]|nr:hypothetical protein C8Q74DRAFT_1437248 [Fomes fomentarius]
MSEHILVICVLETSLALATQWPQVQDEYLMPLIQRLGDGKQPLTQWRMCFVAYGTADTKPTPIVAKHLVMNAPQVLQKLREPHELGVGQTGSGGSCGMATLEGIVAALEIFDAFKPSIEASIGTAQTPWFAVRGSHSVHLSGFPQPQKVTSTKRASNNAPAAGQSSEIAYKRPKVQTAPPQNSPTVAPAAPPSVPPSSSLAAPAQTQVQVATPAQVTALVPAPAPTSMPEKLTLLDPQKRPNIQMWLRMQIAQVIQLQNEGRMEEANELRAQVERFVTQAQARGQGRPMTLGSSTQPAPVLRPPTVANLPEPSQPSATPIQTGSGRPPPALAANQTATAKAPTQTPAPPQVTQDMVKQMERLFEQENRLSQQTLQPTMATATRPPVPGPSATTSRTQWHGTLSWRGFDSETHRKKDVHTRVIIRCSKEHASVMHPESWPSALTLSPSQGNAVSEEGLRTWLQKASMRVPLTIHPQPPSATLPPHETRANEERFRGLIRLFTDKNVYALSAWPGVNGVMENRILLFIRANVLAAMYFPLPGGVPELPKPVPPAPTPAPPAQAPSQPAPASTHPPNPVPNSHASVPPSFPPDLLQILQQQMPPEQLAQFNQLAPEQKNAVFRMLMERTAATLKARQAHQQAQAQAQVQMHAQQQQQQAMGANSWIQGMGGAGGADGTPNPNVATFNLSQLAAQNQNRGQNPAGPAMANLQQMGKGMIMGVAGGVGNLGNMDTGGMGSMGVNFGMGAPPQQQQQQHQQQQQGVMPGMHRRTPSGHMAVNHEMLQSFMQRNQDGSGGPPNGASGGMV